MTIVDEALDLIEKSGRGSCWLKRKTTVNDSTIRSWKNKTSNPTVERLSRVLEGIGYRLKIESAQPVRREVGAFKPCECVDGLAEKRICGECQGSGVVRR